jgi:GNAT superfamily N-acetyltransferase
MECVFSAADRALAFRLEAAEAANGLAIARAANRHNPLAIAQPFAGGTAVFGGVGSPMTHALGIGLKGAVAASELADMESFFRDRGSACLIDLCPMADESVINYVQSNPYRVIEFNNVLARRIDDAEPFDVPHTVRLIPQQERDLRQWATVVATGFAEGAPPNQDMIDTIAGSCGESICFAVGEGEMQAGAAMGTQNGVALFYGDATLGHTRGKGFQSSLIRARLDAARDRGCDLAMVSVLPGSGSHRNYERAGFQLIYMRVNLSREFATA